MITLEQIRLLEGKISRAIDLIRVLKEENATLRRGLESAQKRMKELETLVEGFKTDQREIESVILRTLQHLDDLEETATTKKQERNGRRQAAEAAPAAEPRAPEPSRPEQTRSEPSRQEPPRPELDPTKGELDIF